MVVIGEVLTNCEDDEYRRVKVKSVGVWDESNLMPSLNGIYLDKGDVVLVDISHGVDNSFILAKLRDKKQKEKSQKNEGVIIYEAQKEGKWSELRVYSQNLAWRNSDGVEVLIEGNSITVKCKTAKLEAETSEIKATDIKLDGKVEFTHTFSPATGMGPLCGVPNCLFSGAPHVTNKTQ